MRQPLKTQTQFILTRVLPVFTLAGLLEEKSAIPMVRNRMDLILDLQTDDWWENVKTPMLETVRRHLRSLVKLIENTAESLFILILKTLWAVKPV
jgi:type I site-specific restriction endonuclease